MQPWIPVVVTIVLGALGLGVQGLLLAYFLGKMKEHQVGQAALISAFQKFTDQAITALTARMGAVDAFTAESKADRAHLSARLGGLEQATEGMPRFREEFAAHRAEASAHMKRMESDMNRVNMALEGLQRQVGNLATHGPGQLMELPKKGSKV